MSYPIEINPFATMVMLIRASKVMGKDIDLDQLEEIALTGCEYMKQIDGESPRPYSDFVKKKVDEKSIPF